MENNKWNNITVKDKPKVVFEKNEIEKFESNHKVKLVGDHISFLENLGEGMLFKYVRLFGLPRILKETKEFLDDREKYWFWGPGDTSITLKDISSLVVIGDNGVNDKFVVHPKCPGKVLLIPRDGDDMRDMGDSIVKAIKVYLKEIRDQVRRVDPKSLDEYDFPPVFTLDDY